MAIKKDNIKQIFISLIGLSVVVSVSFPLYRNMKQRYGLEKEMNDLQKEIDSYNKKNDSLKKAINYLKSDQFVEEQARISLGLKKPGEEVVVIKDDNKNFDSTTDSNEIFNIPGLEKVGVDEKKSNFSKWWDYFFITKK